MRRPSDLSRSDEATSDTTLIVRVRDGDAGALDVLLRRYGAPLIRRAAHLLGSADRGQDVVQEVFFQLWRDRATIQVTQDVAAYLFWLTRRRALDALRADQAAMRRDARWAMEVAAERKVQNDGDASIEAEDVRAEVWEALAAVPPRCREIFMLVWDRQLSYAQIASTLGIAVPTVHNQMSRAVKRLVDVFGPRLGGVRQRRKSGEGRG